MKWAFNLKSLTFVFLFSLLVCQNNCDAQELGEMNEKHSQEVDALIKQIGEEGIVMAEFVGKSLKTTEQWKRF